MKQIYASILLLVFTGFLLSISTNFRLYIKVSNACTSVEDINTMPAEEHNEKSPSDSGFKDHLTLSGVLLITSFSPLNNYYYTSHQFSLVENIYFDVPNSPPELG